MTILLRIDCSSRLEGSHSRELADVIQHAWLQKNAGAKVIRRDLACDPVPHIANETTAGFYMKPSQYTPEISRAMKLSDELVNEFLSAQALLLSVPMYNFTVPSSLKAWIDQIVRPGHAFTVDEQGNLLPLVKDKPVYVALSYGYQYTGADFEPYDFVKPYLQSILGFIGLQDLRFISIEGSAAMSETDFANHQAEVFEQAASLA